MTRARPSQKIVLDFIRREVKSGAGFPSSARIAIYMGWTHDGSGRDVLERLTFNGFIERRAVPAANRYGRRYVYSLKEKAA